MVVWACRSRLGRKRPVLDNGHVKVWWKCGAVGTGKICGVQMNLFECRISVFGRYCFWMRLKNAAWLEKEKMLRCRIFRIYKTDQKKVQQLKNKMVHQLFGQNTKWKTQYPRHLFFYSSGQTGYWELLFHAVITSVFFSRLRFGGKILSTRISII
jgi:hypothetical protein